MTGHVQGREHGHGPVAHDDGPARPRHTAALALLAAAVGYPVAVAVHPPTEPGLWPLLVALLAAAAARTGAVQQGRPGRVGLAAGLVLGGAADTVVRTLLRLVTGAPLDGTLLSGATVAVAGLVAGAWAGGRWLAAIMDHAVDRSAPPGNVGPVGHGLLVGGCLVLAAAGWASWGAPPGSWQQATAGSAVVLYAGVALGLHQRLRRTALATGWARSGRVVHPAVARHWGAWVLLLLAGAVAVTSVWWIPPAEPIRRSAEQASPEVVRSARDYVDRHRLTREELQQQGRDVAFGDTIPQGDTPPTDEERRVVSVGELFEWLLIPPSGYPEGEPIDDGDPAARWAVTPQLLVTVAFLVVALFLLAWLLRRSAGGGSPLQVLAGWWARLRAVLAAMLGRRREAAADPLPPTPRQEVRPTRPSRRWRRPPDPREQVKYDYYRVLDLAGRRGLAREPAQSPRQYAHTLHPRVPGHADALDELTSHFVEARYSDHPIDARHARRTKEASRTLRRVLRTVGR